MIRRMLTAIVCRVAGRRCSATRPASRDLIQEMRSRSRSVDAETVRLRRRRNVLEQAILNDRLRQGGR